MKIARADTSIDLQSSILKQPIFSEADQQFKAHKLLAAHQ